MEYSVLTTIIRCENINLVTIDRVDKELQYSKLLNTLMHRSLPAIGGKKLPHNTAYTLLGVISRTSRKFAIYGYRMDEQSINNLPPTKHEKEPLKVLLCKIYLFHNSRLISST